MTAKLEQLYERLRSTKLNLTDYSGDTKDLVFDLFAADSFLAGILDRLTKGGRVPRKFHSGLLEQQLHDRIWNSMDGQAYDLAEAPAEVSAYAQLLENVRRTCVDALRERGDIRS